MLKSSTGWMNMEQNRCQNRPGAGSSARRGARRNAMKVLYFDHFTWLLLGAWLTFTSHLHAAGAVLGWGDNELGQTTVPAAAQSGVTAIAASFHHTVALKSGMCLPALFGDYGARAEASGSRSVRKVIKDSARCVHVAARELRTCQARAPVFVLLPQEIFRAITAGRN